jgi:hypothetical protein
MRAQTILHLFLITAAALSTAGCAADEDDATASDESEVKKRVKPTGGNGAFEFAKPTGWSADGAEGRVMFANEVIAVGGNMQRTPGTYRFEMQQHATANGRVNPQATTITLTAGATVSKKASAVRVRFDKPTTLGGVNFSTNAFTLGLGPWARDAKGTTTLVLPYAGGFTSSSNTSQRTSDFAVAEGELKEIVLPTAKVQVQVDSLDADFPSPRVTDACSAPTLQAGGGGAFQTLAVRNTDGSAIPLQVVPQGDLAPVIVNAYGFEARYTPEAGATANVVLNRLEVDHIEIQGTAQSVPGTYTLERKIPNGWQNSTCRNIPTRTGLDLPDGTYRITSQTTTQTGPIMHVEEVSFP